MITKLGKEIISPRDNEQIPTALYAGEGIAGGLVLRKAVNSGELTGRASLYHGTDKETSSLIRKNGLLPTTEESALNTKQLKNLDPERYKKALGKSYMTKNPLEALTYGVGKSMRGNGGKPSVVRMNVPVWKMKSVVNPEVDMSFDEWKNKSWLLHEKPNFFQERQLRAIYNQLRDNVVIEGAVGPEYVRGSEKYKRNSLKEITEYIRSKPKSFASGALKGLLGAGSILHGGYEIYGRVAGKG